MSMQSLAVTARSATTTPPPGVREPLEVAKLIDVSKCIGCKACQVACMQWNDLHPDIGENTGSYENPADLSDSVWTLMRFAEVEREPGRLEWLIRKDGCMHCADPGCLAACPAPGAIVRYANGIVDFNQEHCIGCGYCITGCPFNIPRLSPVDQKAYKCTLCSDRVAVGLEPACVRTCPTGAILFGSKTDMLQQGEWRVAHLRERGFAGAGLYNPDGVGGTNVMYVLHHADDPALYAGLPHNPRIDPLVELWKGITKPLAIAGLAAVTLISLFHYIAKGPNEVSKETEKEFDK